MKGHSVRDIETSQPPPTAVLDAFTAATITALHELTQLEAAPEPTLSASQELPPGPIVSATIPLRRAVPGRLTLILSATTALELAARYLPDLPDPTELTDELIDDVVGEFANVIAGQAKTILKGTPYHFTLSSPVVTRPQPPARSSLFADVRPAVSLMTELGRVLLLLNLPPCMTA
jgi:CheY-specific phosphatase CheX